MIELLILHELNKRTLTMYGIFTEIKKEFSVYLSPSYGTIKPALKRLEKIGCFKTQKTMSSGGRPSVYYSISKEGKDKLKSLLLEEPLENPINFLSMARIKVACAEFLNNKEQIELFKLLKRKAEIILIDVKKLLEVKDIDFFRKMTLDNLMCEYKNLISLLEGLERACNN